MSRSDTSASTGPDGRQEAAVCPGGTCGPSAGAVIQRYVGDLAGKSILELGLGEPTRMREAATLCARYICVTEDLDLWCGGAIGLCDVAIAHGTLARVARLAHLLEVIRHHLRPRGLLAFSVACAPKPAARLGAIGPGDAGARSDDIIPRTAAEYHTAVTEAGFTVEEMADAVGCVVFRARRR